MAGSYRHVKAGWSMIENMGDAYEAVEELMFLVVSSMDEETVKKKLELFNKYARGEAKPSAEYIKVQEMMQS